jgi:hypothetical protein
VAIARAVPLAIFLGGGFWFVLGCCCVGLASGPGRSEATAHFTIFVLGFTPPAVLGGLPIFDFDVLRDMGHIRSEFVASGVCGGVIGWGVWYAVAMNYKRAALAELEANRHASKVPPDTPFTPPPPAPPGGSGTAAPTSAPPAP